MIMGVVEWSARLSRKRAFRVRRLLAPSSMLHVLLKCYKIVLCLNVRMRKKQKNKKTNHDHAISNNFF